MSTEHEYLNEITDSFIKAVYDVMGEAKGKEAIEALKPVMGKAWKDGIILRKLANDNPTGPRIRFKLKDEYRAPQPGDYAAAHGAGVPKKVNAIKALRTCTGLGLLDSKNLIEQSYESWRYSELSKAQPNDPEDAARIHRQIKEGMQGLMEAGWFVTYA